MQCPYSVNDDSLNPYINFVYTFINETIAVKQK